MPRVSGRGPERRAAQPSHEPAQAALGMPRNDVDIAQRIEAVHARLQAHAGDPVRMAQALFDGSDDGDAPFDAAELWHRLGCRYRRRGDHIEAMQAFLRARTFADAAGLRAIEVHCLEGIVASLQAAGDYDGAIVYAAQWRTRARELSDDAEVAASAITLANLHFEVEGHEAACEGYRQVLHDGSLAHPLRAAALFNLGHALKSLSLHQPARAAFTEALDLVRRHGPASREPELIASLGESHAAEGHLDLALTLLTRARDLARSLRQDADEGRILCRLGHTLARDGQRSRAIDAIRRARDIAVENGDLHAERDALACLLETHLSERAPAVASSLQDLLAVERRLLRSESASAMRAKVHRIGFELMQEAAGRAAEQDRRIETLERQLARNEP